MIREIKALKSQKAFTIMELMIVVVIIAILSMLVYPSYQDSVIKSRRADAKGALLSFANAMERHFTENDTYCGAGTVLGAGCGANGKGTPQTAVFSPTSPVSGGTAYYNLEIRVATPTTFNLRAIATGIQAGDGNLEINNTESRGRWDKNADGVTFVSWD